MKEVFEAIAEDYVQLVVDCYDGDYEALPFQEYLTSLSVIESDGYVETAKQQIEEEEV